MHCPAKKGALMNLSRPDSWQFEVDCLKQTRIVGSIDCLLWREVVRVVYVITVPECDQLKLQPKKFNSHCAELLVCPLYYAPIKNSLCTSNLPSLCCHPCHMDQLYSTSPFKSFTITLVFLRFTINPLFQTPISILETSLSNSLYFHSL